MPRKSKAALEVIPLLVETKERPKPPSGLNAAGKKRWSTIVDELQVDRFRASDLQLLETMIANEQEIVKADRHIKKNGQVVKLKGRMLENPMVRVRDKLMRQTLSLQVKLRLCPSTRIRSSKSTLSEPVDSIKPPWAAKK